MPELPWGYCKFCKREEPVDEDGMIMRHRIASTNTGNCEGGGTEPTEQPAPDMGWQGWKDPDTIITDPDTED